MKVPKQNLNETQVQKRRRPQTSKGRVYNKNVFPIRRIDNSAKSPYYLSSYQLDEKHVERYYMGIMKNILKTKQKIDLHEYFQKPKLIQQKFSSSLNGNIKKNEYNPGLEYNYTNNNWAQLSKTKKAKYTKVDSKKKFNKSVNNIRTQKDINTTLKKKKKKNRKSIMINDIIIPKELVSKDEETRNL
mmetsp:Transcript_7027/g.6219  ORF Transcript_7027/g.6219 Transcript_7027/m.6219 type:complete len:187 (+) Transcript_7027:343-903(+)